jgi:hypothetical protein
VRQFLHDLAKTVIPVLGYVFMLAGLLFWVALVIMEG